MKRALQIAPLIIFMTFIFGCSSSPTTDLYVREDKPEEFLELNSDGTFYSEENGIAVHGEYDITGDVITLKMAAGFASRGTYKGDTIIDKDGLIWVKKSESPLPTRGATPPRSSVAPGGVFTTLMRLVPDTEDTRGGIWINDYARVRDIFDIEIPGFTADDDAINDFRVEVAYGPEVQTREGIYRWFGPAPFLSGFSEFGDKVVKNRHSLAFDVRNVDQTVMPGELFSGIEVVRGRFDPKATDDALDACSECEPPDREEHRGIEFYSWGDDLAQTGPRLEPPAFDDLGRGGRIAVFDDYVFRTLRTRDMEMMIDLYVGRRQSLAEDPDFALLAQSMDRMGAYSVFLTGATDQWGVDKLFSSTELTPEQQARVVPENTLLHDYALLGTGVGQDDKGRFMLVAFVYENPQTAQLDVSILERKIESGSSISTHLPLRDYFLDVEVSSEGRVLLGKLRTDKVRLWMQVIFTPDSLLAHR